MPTAIIDNTPFKHKLGKKQLYAVLKRVEANRKYTNAYMGVLMKSIENDAHQGQLVTISVLLERPEVRFASAIAVGQRLPESQRPTLEQCLAAPKLLNFKNPLAETVPVYPEKKASGGVRMIHNPGLHHRTSQYMVKRIMGAYFAPRAFQFTHRGIQFAIAEVKKAILEGHTYVARFDIKNFYPSFDLDQLVQELPLPQEVVEHVVHARHMKVVLDPGYKSGAYVAVSSSHTHESLLAQARLGIPQGSICSSIVSNFLMSRLAWSPMQDVVLVNYADDFLLLAKSPPMLADAGKNLMDAVAKLPGGHFKLKVKQERTVAEGFEFLGHHMRMMASGLQTSASPKNQNQVYKKLHGIEEKLSVILPKTLGPIFGHLKASALETLANMYAVAQGWAAAFRECDDAASVVQFAMYQIEDWCKLLGVSLKELEPLVHRYMLPAYHGKWYGDSTT